MKDDDGQDAQDKGFDGNPTESELAVQQNCLRNILHDEDYTVDYLRVVDRQQNFRTALEFLTTESRSSKV